MLATIESFCLALPDADGCDVRAGARVRIRARVRVRVRVRVTITVRDRAVATLTRASRGLRTVRTGHAYQPLPCLTYHRVPCGAPPQGATRATGAKSTGELSNPNHPNPNPNPNPTLIDLQVGHTDIIRPLQI